MKAAVLALCAASFSPAFASVYVADASWYIDSAGAYAAVGAVNNDSDSWVLPRVHVSAAGQSGTAHLPPVAPGSEMPFKVRLAAPPDAGPPTILLEHDPAGPPATSEARVLYDSTLVMHADGRQAGMVVNTGDAPLRDVRVYAVAHAEDGSVLDVGQASVAEALPGEPAPFEMFADPAVAAQAASYSCFAVGDPLVVEYTTERNGEPYQFRYDSAVWLAYAQFDGDGKSMNMVAKNSFPFEALANIELPRGSDSEELRVTLDGEPVESQQSRGEMDNWHLVFAMEPFSDGYLEITGFEDVGEQPGAGWYPLLAVPAAAAAGLALYRRRAPSRDPAP